MARSKNTWFEVSYTKNDGTKITGQLYTADHISNYLKNLLEWDATDIEVKEYKE